MRHISIAACLFLVLGCSMTPDTGAQLMEIYRAERKSHDERMKTLFNVIHDLDGTPYAWGGNSPKRGMDCSGFTKYVMAKIGIRLPRTSREQARVGEPIMPSRVQTGDLIFFDTMVKRKGIDHVGIYLGRGYFAHSASPEGVRLDNIKTYKHRMRFGRRVIYSSQEMLDKVTRAVRAEEKPKPEPKEEPKPKPPKKRYVDYKKGKGKLVSLEKEGDTVKYTLHLGENEYYEFMADWNSHTSYAEEQGHMLDKMILWDEETYCIEEDD